MPYATNAGITRYSVSRARNETQNHRQCGLLAFALVSVRLRKEFFDPGGRLRVRGRNADNLRDRCQLDDADQGVDAGRAVCSNKEMLLAPKGAGCERAFGGAVIELRAPGKRRGY
jgi:hypothetical protein